MRSIFTNIKLFFNLLKNLLKHPTPLNRASQSVKNIKYCTFDIKIKVTVKNCFTIYLNTGE